MTTEKELKDRLTPDIIEKMVELAEGFENKNTFWFYDLLLKSDSFPLLIHRAVEGWNKLNDKHILIYHHVLILATMKRGTIKELFFKNYQPENLTQAECAMLDCLIDILKLQKED